MRSIKFSILLIVLFLFGCAEKGEVNVLLNQGYTEFTIQSKHKEIESVTLKINGESSCEVAIKTSKQPVDTIGTGILNFKKSYPWRAGEFKVKVYSPRCIVEEKLNVKYTFKK